MRSLIVQSFAQQIGESKIAALDLASSYQAMRRARWSSPDREGRRGLP
jgi:hypothetical protein